GGWPLTGFLTPEGEAFLGGTYFPAEDGLGRPGFRRVLQEIARLWADEPEKIRANTEAIRGSLDRLRAHAGAHGRDLGGSALLDQVREQLGSSYDPVHAGFGLAPKFPHPTAVAFLLWDGFTRADARSSARALETLRRMADGGMYDQLGGGFHRYAVDEGWHIPHFEKMGIDNAALLSAYVEGSRRFGEPRLLETVRGIGSWALDVLAQPDGGFGASQDADNAPGDDGRYFTWTRAALRELLPADELRLVSRRFGIGTEGRMPHDPEENVLYRMMSVEDLARGSDRSVAETSALLDRATAAMRKAREARPRPAVDPARYASINGPLLGALAQAASLEDDPARLAAARRAADRFLKDGFEPDRGIAHWIGADGPGGFGLLEDNASFALGLVELAGVTAEPRYALTAEQLLGGIERSFGTDVGLFQDLAPSIYDGPSVGALGERLIPVEDNPHLSPNGAAALAWIRFGSLTNSAEAIEKARRIVRAMSPRLDGAGLFAAGAALALGLLETPPARVVIEGSGPSAEALLRAARRAWHPNLWVFRGPPPAPFGLPEELGSAAARVEGEARALVCFGTHCLAPIADPAALGRSISSAGRPDPK
ncbi:MAG TPA: DUF255 domain-containing protein, partial [Thermoplasmata archaeon]|nr:DUF255 domain-containing protein [Thermoplasmata archaeon]